jgi:hypothetical protein
MQSQFQKEKYTRIAEMVIEKLTYCGRFILNI